MSIIGNLGNLSFLLILLVEGFFNSFLKGFLVGKLKLGSSGSRSKRKLLRALERYRKRLERSMVA